IPVALERAKVAGDLQPRLRGDVFGVGPDERLQVAQEDRLECPVQVPECLLVTLLRGGDRRSQGGLLGGRRIADHGTARAHTVMMSSVWPARDTNPATAYSATRLQNVTA